MLTEGQIRSKLIRKAKSKVSRCMREVDIHFPVGTIARKEMFDALKSAMEALKGAEAIDQATAYAERVARRANQPTE